MSSKPFVVAIALSDIHLSAKPPRLRANEDDWYEAQARQLREVKKLAEKYQCPVLCAGDVFDRWDAPAELINFALRELPDGMVCIPGQHDLPYHSLEHVNRSAYGTLIHAGKIVDLSDPCSIYAYTKKKKAIEVTGFPWGSEITPASDPQNKRMEILNIAIIHAYIWMDEKTSYPNAPEDKKIWEHGKRLKGYDVAVFGDNHIPFISVVRSTTIFNHGTFYRRHSPDLQYEPQVGLIKSDGTVAWHFLKSWNLDVYEEDLTREALIDNFNSIYEFVKSANMMGESKFDYKAALERHIEKHRPSKEVVSYLRQMVEKGE